MASKSDNTLYRCHTPTGPVGQPDTVTFREFWALCLAQYRILLPGMLATMVGLLLTCALIEIWLR